MAKMHPPRFPHSGEPGRHAEGRFYRACEQQLDDGWTVLYEQHWHGNRNGRNQRGEADFLMFHAKRGVFVVEVKGGQEIGVSNGEWFTVPKGSTTKESIKNPFTQVADSKSILWEWLRKNVPSLPLRGELGHMVVFPGHRQQNVDMSVEARRQLICDRDDMQSLEATMDRVSRYFSQRTRWSDSEIAMAKNKLMPTFKLLGPRAVEFDEFFDQLNQLTDFQLKAFAMLRKQNKLNVHGGAGTGKTILAFHRAIELMIEGKDVLFLCHSEALREYLLGELEKRKSEIKVQDGESLGNLDIHSSTSFEESFENRGGKVLSEGFLGRWILTPEIKGKDSNLYIEKRGEENPSAAKPLEEVCFETASAGERLIDALIIDEAQSINPKYVSAAQFLLKDGGYQYIFGDMNQKFPSTWDSLRSALDEFGKESPVVLNVNCRSSMEIAEFAHAFVSTPIETVGSSFANVTLKKCSLEAVGRTVNTVIGDWKKEFGLNLNDVKVLLPNAFVRDTALLGLDSFADNNGFSMFEDFVIDWDVQSRTSVKFQWWNFNHFAWYQRQLAQGIANDNVPMSSGRAHLKKEFEDRNRLIEDIKRKHAETGDAVAPEHFAEIEKNYSLYLKSRLDVLKDTNLPVLKCINFEDFIGLESHAVVAVLPVVSQRFGFKLNGGRELAYVAYVMATRARALLAVVGNGEAVGSIRSWRDGLAIPENFF
ncbi:MAG: NERD domain-containing protein/DEAD/DEAH box helicase [Actinomycetota bacterium]|nr:NERD domain-containing protein/DEAD/DEAH box helicase [Actinomycetota bacterium]